MYPYNKGSEWRRWDLHFHTPSSYDYENKSITNQQIIDKLVENDIAVIAITDHHIIDVERIKDLQHIGKGKITILPGIEFCSELGGSESIHFIGIFSETVDIESIWTKIQGKHNLTKADKDRKGEEKIICKFEETCSTIRELGGIVTVHAGKKANTIESIKNNLLVKQEQKQELLSKYISILEIGKIEDENDYKTKVFPSIGFELPIIICSDNHNAVNYSTKENLWIKADPNFEGLKQILCEPSERVKIQVKKPDNKLSYNIIEKVKFVDNSGQNKFPDYEIGFNPGLNAIIGGKSSGKSLLLHMIAKEIGDKTDLKDYSEVLSNVQLNVYYADDVNTHKTTQDKRIIEFLPQLFIERIVRNRTSSDKDDTKIRYFDHFIESLIQQDKDIKDQFDKHSSITQQASALINTIIIEWKKLDDALSKAKDELRPLGDKKAIENEIENKEKERNKLTEATGLTEEEIKQYRELVQKNEDINNQQVSINRETNELQRLNEYISSISEKVNQDIIFTSEESSIEQLFSEMKEKMTSTIDAIITEYQTKILEKENILIEKLKKCESNKQLNDTSLSPFLEKMKIKDNIENIEKEIKIEKEKLNNISTKEKQIIELQQKIKSLDFIPPYVEIFESFEKLQITINQKISEKWEEAETKLTLTAISNFDIKAFVESISSSINMKTYLENQFPNCGFETSQYNYTKDTHIKNIQSILNISIAETNRFNNFKTGHNTEELLRALLKNHFYVNYDISKGGDSLHNMSEGKKGIVILQLYLSLSKSDCPILVDQPEDNLDNRTVYQELNDYIKICKQHRQIIMVSHNANLVVNTDAENIIVANQSGEDGKDNKKFKFEYVNGALENTSSKDIAQKGILYQQGIREHVCEILEGGVDAFKKREEKYHINN